MLSALVAALLAAPIQVAPIGDGNAMTLPAGRHLMRMEPGGGRPAVWLAAIQQDGAAGHRLGFFRSDDEAQTWRYYAPIQDDPSEIDRVDLLKVGNDIALVYSYEGPRISQSALHSVYFQWWRYDGKGGWNPSAPVTAMRAASDNSNGYLRGEIAIDSAGRIWAQAMRIEADGSFTVCMAVSTNGGATFTMQPTLGSFANRPGGRILSLGSRLMLLYSTHGVDRGYMRLRNDGDPVGSWGPAQAVFPEGIYHGAALSAVGDGNGGVHLVYKDVNETLWYRFFDGSSWSARTSIESNPDWATQPAVTRVGSDVLVFWNHPVSSNTDYRYRYLTIHAGSIGSATTLDDSSGFKGYPAAAEVLPGGVPGVPCLYGNTPDASSGGTVNLVRGVTPIVAGTPDAGTPDAGTSVPDAGTPDAGTSVPDAGTPDAGPSDAGTSVPDAGTPLPDAGTPLPDAGPPLPDAGTPLPDAGTPTGGTTILFADTFNRTAPTLGSAWRVVKGAFIVDTRGNTDLNAPDQAMVPGLSCADCTVQADVDGFGDAVAIDLRVSAAAPDDRYDLILQPGGNVQIRKHRGGVISVLGDAVSGIPDTGNFSTLTLSAAGSGPVSLVARVNGVVKLSVADSSNVLGAGSAGISAAFAGIWFRNFSVVGNVGAGGGGTDGGTPDAGAPDAGAPDAGTPDAGTPDAGTPVPDAGIPTGGATILFADTFNRTAPTLGSAWRVVKGAFIVDTRGNTDLNAPDQAMVPGLSCADCTVQADVDGFGDAVAIDLRVSAAAPDDRYDLILQPGGNVQIRKHRGGVISVLGDAVSGIPDTGNFSTLTLSAAGSGPVSLVARVNGVVKLSVADSSNVLGAGSAGISAAFAGIWFRNFSVVGNVGGGGGGTDGGTPDAGAPDAGAPDAGTPDAGAPDAGAPDAGTPDAGTPDAGTPDAGAPGGGTPDAGTSGGGGGLLFADALTAIAPTLSPAWTVVAGAFIEDTRANTDNNAPDQAMVSALSCADCTVQADVIGFGDPVAIDLRVSPASPDDRYDLILQSDGHVQVRKHRGGVVTVLGDVASGIADTGNWSTLSLGAAGSGPVSLVASVNGVALLSVSDASDGLGAGSAGISAALAGIWFRNFSVVGAGRSAGGATDGGTPDAGTPDAGTPDAGPADAGPADAGTPDAGTPDAGPVGGGTGTSLAMQVTYIGADYDLMAVDRFGTAYGNRIGDSNANLYASTDGRTWTFAGTSGNGGGFHVITALSTGTLLADTQIGNQHTLERSTNHGSTWTDVLPTGLYYALSPHSYAELDGAVYYTEYQVFTGEAVPIHLWKSVDDGQTWSVVQTFTTHRHGHGLIADPARHALWAVFGDTDPQSGTYRSTDAGQTWTAMATAQAGDIVDGTILPDGSLLAGQDISFQPTFPNVARIGLDGSITNYVQLPSASYSTHAVRSGGYVAGATREQGADVTDPSVTTGSLWGSGDGVHWAKLLDVQEANTVDDCRTDVYWELPTGELVVSVKGASGFGADGRGYLLIKTQVQ